MLFRSGRRAAATVRSPMRGLFRRKLEGKRGSIAHGMKMAREGNVLFALGTGLGHPVNRIA
jgi:hypothetical protein